MIVIDPTVLGLGAGVLTSWAVIATLVAIDQWQAKKRQEKYAADLHDLASDVIAKNHALLAAQVVAQPPPGTPDA